ncbi:helix-turn-helix transcriptional regulator [Natronoglomus mannanivorans]|uniref:helix-turn-helix transcriptional regulator n=1 Tax=Natronoglomus mannanivorans TaxID=2979990 RepID=UPI003CCC9D16
MSSSIPLSETGRTTIERICNLLPVISPPNSSAEHSDTPVPEESPTEERGPEFLSREERVLHILETQGGRIWQADVVSHTDWSKSTASRVLSEMEASEEIRRVRVGRQKVVCLPEPTRQSATDSHEAAVVE